MELHNTICLFCMARTLVTSITLFIILFIFIYETRTCLGPRFFVVLKKFLFQCASDVSDSLYCNCLQSSRIACVGLT